MIYTNGKRGRSKVEVRLSINVVFEAVALHVWEQGKITHTFYPDREFLSAMQTHAADALKRLESLELGARNTRSLPQ